MTLIAWASTQALAGKRLSEWLVMIPNENLLSMIAPGGRRYAYWAKLQKLGFRRGASDLMLAFPHSSKAGLWVEMKRRRDAFPYPSTADRSVSDHQSDFQAQMVNAGYAAVVAFGWEEARTAIQSYLSTSPALMA